MNFEPYSTLTPTDRLILTVLATIPSSTISRLSMATGSSPSYVAVAAQHLCTKGLIVRRKRGRVSEYSLATAS
jgi:DNA-binding MarR family transcriptional regulator